MRSARARRKPACRARAEIGASDQRMVDRYRRRNRNARFSSQAVIISRHVHEQWRNIDQAVDAIQDSAMPRNRRAHVLGSDVSFDQADGEIAKQSTYSDDQTGKNQLCGAEKWKRESQQPGQNHRNRERAKRAFPSFVWTDFAAKRMPPKQSAKCKSGDVI